MAAPVAAKVAIHVAQSKTGRRVVAGVLAFLLALIAIPFVFVGTVISSAGGSEEQGSSSCVAEDLDGYSPKQLQYVQTIATVGEKLDVPQKGIEIAVAVALVETGLQNYANSNVPGSLKFPHDKVGSDHDSIGIVQQRVSSNFGSIEELMTPSYAAKAFFGGKDGPNNGSPPGLLDIPGWEKLDFGVAAQRVQVSAFPTRYAEREKEAKLLLKNGGTECGGGSGELVGKLAYPIAKGTHAGTYAGHHGVDFPMPQGTPIYSIADGEVTYAGREGFGARVVFIRYPGGLMAQYAHMHEGATGVLVKSGDKVKAGQKIGEVGTSGMSSGNHLHFELEQDVPASQTQFWESSTAPYRWLKRHKIAPGPLHAECGNCGFAEIPDDFAYSGAYSR